MTNAKLFSEIATLPDSLKAEVEDFVHSLIQNKNKKNSIPKKDRQFGCAKGLIKMAPDFDESLTDFKDYM